MAKIDLSKIDNFENMDADALRKFLTDFEYDDNAAELSKLKNEAQKLIKAKDDATSEAASFKKQLREKQSEAERLEAERIEELERLKNENKSFRLNALINGYKASAISMGYSEELAQKRAEAMSNNDFKAMYEIDKQFLEEHDKKLNANAITNTSRPPVGGAKPENGGLTKDQFRSMGYMEKAKLYDENPELYAELNK